MSVDLVVHWFWYFEKRSEICAAVRCAVRKS